MRYGIGRMSVVVIIVKVIGVMNHRGMTIPIAPMMVMRMIAPINIYRHDPERRVVRWVISVVIRWVIWNIDRGVDILNDWC